MKNIVLSLRFFRRHWAANVIIALEIVFLLFWTTTLINRSSFLYYHYNLYADSELQNSVYYMGRVGVFSEDEMNLLIADYQDEFLSELFDFPYVRDIARMSRFSSGNEIIYVFDDITAEMNEPALEGRWLSDRLDDNEIVAYNTSTHIGDTIDLNIHLYNEFVTDNDTEHTIITKTASFTVIGEIKTLPSTFMHQNSKSNGVFGIDALLMNNVGNVDQAIYYISAEHPFFSDYPLTTDNCFIYLDESISDDQYEELRSFLSQYGYSMSGKEMLEDTKKDADSSFQYDLSGLISFVIVVMASVICLTFLNVKRFRSYISLYYLCGCSFGRSVSIYKLFATDYVSGGFRILLTVLLLE